MKKITLLLLLSVTYSTFCSCESEGEKKKREAEERIYSSLTMRAKLILNNPDTYRFERMNDYRVNDSIRVYAQRFSGANSFGVRESKYAIGYFNVNTGVELFGDMLSIYASNEELESASKIVDAR